jgi:hypothetical protein
MADESDSDDNLPIAQLVKKRLLKQASENKNKATTEEKIENKNKIQKILENIKAEKNNKKSEESSKSNKITETAKASVSRQATANKSSDFYENTQKGQLVQTLLVRWWYAIEWPKPEDIAQPPLGYEALDGFPGVFVSTKVSCN